MITWSRILTLVYHIKIYTGRDRSQAWTASSKSGYPVSCIWYWPIIYLEAEKFMFAVQISIQGVGVGGQKWRFVPAFEE